MPAGQQVMQVIDFPGELAFASSPEFSFSALRSNPTAKSKRKAKKRMKRRKEASKKTY